MISAFVLLVDVSPPGLKRATVTETEHKISGKMHGHTWVHPYKHPRHLRSKDAVHTYVQKAVPCPQMKGSNWQSIDIQEEQTVS